MRFVHAVSLASALVCVFAAACGTEATSVEACVQIEEARCERAPGCGIALDKPLHADTPQTDVDACKRFYRDACQHGTETTKDPGAVAVKACVDAIRATADCEVVKTPEKAAECAWLIPPPPPAPVVDASPDVAATDASDARAD